MKVPMSIRVVDNYQVRHISSWSYEIFNETSPGKFSFLGKVQGVLGRFGKVTWVASRIGGFSTMAADELSDSLSFLLPGEEPDPTVLLKLSDVILSMEIGLSVEQK